MENVYKIKIKSNPTVSGIFPSERRYSASTVLGLGVVHLALALTTILLAFLSFNRNHAEQYVADNTTDSTSMAIVDITNADTNTTDYLEVSSRDNFTPENTKTETNANDNSTDKLYSNLSIGPCVMALGALSAGLTGLLAWKRWYIDQNIKWFFISSAVSVITSSTCLLLTAFTVTSIGELNNIKFSYDMEETVGAKPSLSLVVAVNVLIASVSEVIWSILSAKVAYQGMISQYPDEMDVTRSRGKIEVNTVTKGNGKNKIPPPDILNHFPKSGKFAKYFPKKDNSDLPKAESHSEYQERVNKFLRSQSDSNSAKNA